MVGSAEDADGCIRWISARVPLMGSHGTGGTIKVRPPGKTPEEGSYTDVSIGDWKGPGGDLGRDAEGLIRERLGIGPTAPWLALNFR